MWRKVRVSQVYLLTQHIYEAHSIGNFWGLVPALVVGIAAEEVLKYQEEEKLEYNQALQPPLSL